MGKKWIAKIVSLMLAFCMVFATAPAAIPAAEANGNGGFTPKRMFLAGMENPGGSALAQKVSLAASEFEAKEVCGKLPIVYGDVSFTKEGDILVRVSDTLAKDAYEVAVDGGKATLTAGSDVSALYGLRDMMKRLLLTGEISQSKWVEAPDVSQRIFHLDCGRKYFSKDFIISLIKELSWLQMNQLEMDFSNGTGFRFALDDMFLDVDGDGNSDEDLSVLLGGVTDPSSFLTQSEMDEIIKTAGEYGVEIVPCLDSPGHTGWIVGKDAFQKYALNGDLDVENDDAKRFMKAIVSKYAKYFVDRGCKTFHIGGDEYLHGYYNWGTPVESTEGKYAVVADYLDSLAGDLKQLGVTKIRSFNDPLYYNGDLTTHTWENIDEAEYWCYNGMNSFRYASPGLLAEQGLQMINGHGDFYGLLTGGDLNWKEPVGNPETKKTPAGIYAQFQNNIFAGNQEIADPYVAGSTYFMWCDDPTQGTQQDVAKSLFPRLRAASAKMWDEAASGTFADFAKTFTDSAGGFLADGSLQELTLPAPSAIVNADDRKPDPDESDPKPVTYDISGAAIGAIARQYYTGAAVTPQLAISYAGKPLAQGIDYTVSYAGNVNIGTATVTVTGIGSYYGAKTATFEIGIKKGSVWKIDGFRYKVTDENKGTVAVLGMYQKKNNVTIKDTVTIGGKTFRITEIAAGAFQKNGKLKKVTIGKNVEKIGKKAFYNCKKLNKIQIHTRKLNGKCVGKDAFGKTNAKMSMKVPKGKKAAYKKFLYKKGCSKKAKIQ